MHQFNPGFSALSSSSFTGFGQGNTQQYLQVPGPESLAGSSEYALQQFPRPSPAWPATHFLTSNRSPTATRLQPPPLHAHTFQKPRRDSAPESRGGIKKPNAIVRRRISRAW